MDRCVVRQAIKETATGRIIGYELLFQGGEESFFEQSESSAADTIVNFLINNSSKFVNDKKMFITFNSALLFRNTLRMFEPDKVVAQLDDNLIVNPLARPFIRKYRNLGYQFAVSDFQFSLKYLEMLDDVKYIRLNMKNKEMMDSLKDRGSLENIISMAHGTNKKCIAAGISTKEAYEYALSLNVDYLEGNYIARTLVTKVDKITYMKGNFFQLLTEMLESEPDVSKIEEIVSRDAGLTFALLKLVNSAYFALRRRTASVRQALVTMGMSQLRQWVYMLSFEQEQDNTSAEELLKISFLRAKFASELVRHMQDSPITSNEAYIMGMFSTMEYMVDAPIEEIIEDIPLNDEVREALAGKESPAGSIYQLVLAYERADWKHSQVLAESLGVPANLLAQMYVDCVEDVNSIWNTLTTEYLRKGEKPLFSEQSDGKVHIEDVLK